MEYLPVTIKCRINVDGNLIPDSPEDSIRKDIFKNSLAPGTLVEVTYQVFNPDKSNAQLDKIHKLIRILSSETGDEFLVMKEYVKERAGLKDKSFADCSKEELSEAIKAAMSMGEFLNCNLNTY